MLSLHLPRLQQLHILLLHRGSIAYASGLADTHRLLRCTPNFETLGSLLGIRVPISGPYPDHTFSAFWL